MAHALDFTTGRAGVAFVGDTPWHGLGQHLTPGANLETWQHEAGLEWEAKVAPVKFDRQFVDFDGSEKPILTSSPENVVLYRSDSGSVLSVVSNQYRPVQPKQIIEFYRDLTEKYGLELQTAGSLKGGRKIWALAKTPNAFQLRGHDDNRLYLLLATSFDGSMATQVRRTDIRVVCNNTIDVAVLGTPDIVISHSAIFDADKVKLNLGIGDAWEAFQVSAEAMSRRLVDKEESVRFFLDVYYGLDSDEKMREFQKDEANNARVEKFTERIQHALFNSPGAHMESAKGMLWGLVQACTYDVDYQLPARTQNNRLDKAWFGAGVGTKQRAWNRALAMVG